MRVLRSYPPDKLDLKPATMCKSARELAWVFAIESSLGQMVFQNALASGPPSGGLPVAPGSLEEILTAVENGHRDFRAMIASTPDAAMNEKVKFFTAPRTLGDMTRTEFLWFMLHDEIHHRGQFSIYVRMAGGKVPSIYGPTAEEPWM